MSKYEKYKIIKKNIEAFLKKEMVLCIAGMLALITMFIVPPSKEYIEYIDFRVLSLLFCFMMVIAGFSGMGVFDELLKILLKVVKNIRQLSVVLVIVCFATSMWITNDVALITFVPLAIMVINRLKRDDLMIYVIVMQTVAANLGSMCTPIGNPQSLYLYSVSGMDIKSFIKLMLPITLLCLILIIICLLFIKKDPIDSKIVCCSYEKTDVYTRKTWKLLIFAGMFMLAILTVFHIVDYRITLAVIIALTLIVQPKLFRNVDYSLLITFIAFFIFVGNVKNIQFINDFLHNCVKNNEILVSILASQCISNVPAAVLLSGFTENYAGLLVGTNIGGLGTLIASMASLISYKFYVCTQNCNVKKYIAVFTIINVVFLLILVLSVYFFM